MMKVTRRQKLEQEATEIIHDSQKTKTSSFIAPLQCRFSNEEPLQLQAESATKANALTQNRTGMSDKLKSGLEKLSGYDLSSVRVHYNSPKPRQLGALAYAQGTNIHLGQGQEKHLPHEGWHVVQQMQGRVRPTLQMKHNAINDDVSLEKEADVMGGRALNHSLTPGVAPSFQESRFRENVVQRARTRVSKAGAPPWTWTQNLNATWGGYNIPVHPCFSKHVPVDKLYGGWTVIDSAGTYRSSGVYGPYKPGLSKDKHVERKFFNAMQNDLEQEMADDDTYNDNALAIVEINQYNTPCSGPKGCTTFLNNKVNELNTLYNEVSAAGRFRATVLYESSVSEMYPKHPKMNKDDVEEFSDDEMDLGGGEVMHEKIKPRYG